MSFSIRLGVVEWRSGDLLACDTLITAKVYCKLGNGLELKRMEAGWDGMGGCRVCMLVIKQYNHLMLLNVQVGCVLLRLSVTTSDVYGCLDVDLMMVAVSKVML